MSQPVTPRLSRPARGFTWIEALCVLSVLSVLFGAAWPGLRDLRTHQVLQAVAASLETDVHLARSAALAGNRRVRLTVRALPDGSGSCTMVHTGSATACTCDGGGQARCDAGAQLLRLSEQPLADGAAISSVDRSLIFDPAKGTVTPTATLTITDRQGQRLRKVVNVLGRMRTCSPDGLAGMPTCS